MKESATENIYRLPLVLEPQLEGGCMITCPVLPGLIMEVDTMDEVLPNITDALEALIEMYEDLNQPLPKILQPVEAGAPLYAETLIKLTA